MLIRLQNSAAAMTAMMRQQERTANNLANAGTVGYKRDQTFVEALNERLDAELAPRSDQQPTQYADLGAGAMEETGNPLDVALGTDGFFVTTDEATGAERFTRAGRFTRDLDGFLRDPMGALVQGEAGPIQLPPQGTVGIQKDGAVQVDGQLIDRLRVVRFANPLALQRLDGAAFAAGGQAPDEVEVPVVLQGFVEGSNADPVREMTDMIQQFRFFEAQQKLLQSQDQILGAVTRDLGKF